MKKLLSFFMVLTMVCTLFAAPVSAMEEEAELLSVGDKNLYCAFDKTIVATERLDGATGGYNADTFGKTVAITGNVTIPAHDTAVSGEVFHMQANTTSASYGQLRLYLSTRNGVYGLYAGYVFSSTVIYYPIAAIDKSQSTTADFKIVLDTEKHTLRVYNVDGTVTGRDDMDKAASDRIFSSNDKITEIKYTDRDVDITYNSISIDLLERDLTAEFTSDMTADKSIIYAEFSDDISEAAVDGATYRVLDGNGDEVTDAEITAEFIEDNKAAFTVSAISGETDYTLCVDNMFSVNGRTSEGELTCDFTTARVSADISLYTESSIKVNSSVSKSPKPGNTPFTQTVLVEMDVTVPDGEFNNEIINILTTSSNGNENYPSIKLYLTTRDGVYGLYSSSVASWNAGRKYYPIAVSDGGSFGGTYHVKIALDTQKKVMLTYDVDGNVTTHDISVQSSDIAFSDESHLTAIEYKYPGDEVTFENVSIKLIERTLYADIVTEETADSAKAYITFSEPVNFTDIKDNFKVEAPKGEYPVCKITEEDESSISVELSELQKGSEYRLLLDNVFSINGRTTDGPLVDYIIKTAKNEKIYLTDESDFSGGAFVAEVAALTDNCTATVALVSYDEKEEPVKIEFKSPETFSKGKTPVYFYGFDDTKTTKAYIWTDNWVLMHIPVVVNDTEASEMQKSPVMLPDFSVRVTDVSEKIVTVSGKCSGADKLVTVMLSESEKIEDYETKTIALGSAVTDKDGVFAYSFKLPVSSGSYTAFVCVDGTVYSKPFEYLSPEEIASVIKDIAKGEISKDNIYSSAITKNAGLGINNTDYFKTDRDIALFNKRVDACRANLTGPSDTEYIAQFMAEVAKVTGEIDYINELSAITYYGLIYDKLASGTEYTGITFNSYYNLNNEQKAYAQKLILGKTFADADEVKTKFDKAVEEASEYTSSSGSSGGSGGGGGNRNTGASGANSGSDAVQNPQVPEQTVTADNVYTDLSGYTWAKDAILNLSKRGIINGKGNGEFAPADHVTREQFAKMVILAIDKYDTTAVSIFDDVPSDSWYASYVASAQKAGIINGVDDSNFGSGKYITREEMAVMIYRAFTAKGITLDGDKDSFNDMNTVSSYAYSAVSRLAGSGIINGVGDNTFAPKKLSTRAEAAVLIESLVKGV